MSCTKKKFMDTGSRPRRIDGSFGRISLLVDWFFHQVDNYAAMTNHMRSGDPRRIEWMHVMTAYPNFFAYTDNKGSVNSDRRWESFNIVLYRYLNKYSSLPYSSPPHSSPYNKRSKNIAIQHELYLWTRCQMREYRRKTRRMCIGSWRRSEWEIIMKTFPF